MSARLLTRLSIMPDYLLMGRRQLWQEAWGMWMLGDDGAGIGLLVQVRIHSHLQTSTRDGVGSG
jgi:hypothetical protein